MSYTVPTLLLRNLHDVFGEIDPVRRRAAVDEIFHEDAVFHEPNGTYRGRDEIDRIAGVIKATHPDFRYQPFSPPEVIGDGGRVRWVSRSLGKPPATLEPISSSPGTARLPPSIFSLTNFRDLDTGAAKVCFGSKADMCRSRHVQCNPPCPLRAKSGHHTFSVARNLRKRIGPLRRSQMGI
jgi:hypothetical protein